MDRFKFPGKTDGKKTDGKRNRRLERLLPRIFTGALLFVLLCGCAAGEEEQEELVIMEPGKEQLQYDLAIASRGDIFLTKTLQGIYEELEKEEVCFPVSGRLVTSVYVKEGEAVKKGQLLAQLGDSDLSRQVRELEYQIRRNEKLLEQADVSDDYEISTEWLRFLYQSGNTDEEEEATKERVAQIQQRYQYMREDYQDAIDLNRLKLERIRSEMASNRIYAGMDGIVSWILPGLEGSTSRKDQGVIQITDDSICLLTIDDMEEASFFREGEILEMVISHGDQAGTYQITPYGIEEWEDKMLFSMIEENTEIEPGTLGKITLSLESRENVLNVPIRAIHTVDGKQFVYCLGEDGLCEVKWVTTGLYGDDRVEILSGIEEGEKIVLR